MRLLKRQNSKRHTRGQSIVEYMGFITLLALAMSCFFMRDYFRNAIMGRMRQDMERTVGIEKSGSVSVRRNVTHRIVIDPIDWEFES